MELLFVRHGEPEWVRNGRSIDDPDLTERGRQQASHLAERLADLAVDQVLVSPLARAQQTAAPLCSALRTTPVTLDWLAEIAAPRWEGTPAEQVERAFRENRARPVDEQWDGMPGGESFRDFHLRVSDGLHGLLEDLGVRRTRDYPAVWDLDRPPHRVVIVAHSGTNSVALGALLGIEPVPWEWERFVSFHASVSTVRHLEVGGAATFSLFRFADTSHLPERLQTV